MEFKNKKGLISLLIILLVLVVSTFLAYAVTRQKGFRKSTAANAAGPTPAGVIHVDKATGPNNGVFTFTATGVTGADGAQIDNVRYYLLNPSLASGNNWGDPSWCSSGGTCTQQIMGGLITYDISESSNPGNNYQIIWDKNTHSSGSTAYSRALSVANIKPGKYTVGLRVEDVNGNVNGLASSVEIVITDGTLPSPSPTPDLGLKFSTSYFGLKLAPGGMGLKAFDLTSTGATKFNFYAPTNSLGILLSPSSGSIAPGQTIPIYVKASDGQASGIYTGTVYIDFNNAQTSTGVTDSITVEPVSYDSDKDGFTNYRENKIGTDPNYACKTPTGVNAWPPDVNNDGTVNTLDQSAIAGIFNARIGDSRYNRRYDLNADGAINSADLGLDASYNGKSCS